MESTRGVLEPKIVGHYSFLGSKMGSEMVSSTLKKIIKNHPKLYILDDALMRQTLQHLHFL